MHLLCPRSGFLIRRCTALPILSNQCSNCFYKLRDNVQPPIWEPDQTKIGTRSKKIKDCNQSTHCVSIQIRFCYIHCRERKWKTRASIQKRIPESWKMAEMGVVNRSCIKAPIFADAFWAGRRWRRCCKAAWHWGSRCVTLRMPRGRPVYSQPSSVATFSKMGLVEQIVHPCYSEEDRRGRETRPRWL